MKTVRLMLEWGCDPVWVYEEDGIASWPGLPGDLENNKDLVSLMNKISDKHDSQYINIEKEFTGVGFKTEAERKEFKQDLIKFSAMVKAAVGNKYKFVDDFNYELKGGCNAVFLF